MASCFLLPFLRWQRRLVCSVRSFSPPSSSPHSTSICRSHCTQLNISFLRSRVAKSCCPLLPSSSSSSFSFPTNMASSSSSSLWSFSSSSFPSTSTQHNRSFSSLCCILSPPFLPHFSSSSTSPYLRHPHMHKSSRGIVIKKPPIEPPREKLRNIAIIAHVDHGKTTLVDQLLKQGGQHRQGEDRMMDSNDLERERGITILSKVTRIQWNGYVLNIIDTPGHADFGGEVERILSMVDGVCLIVDIVEGPRTQTKFVLQKALMNPKCKPIVVINKVDRPNQRAAGDCENEVFDLFMNLDAAEEQLDYVTLYASGKNGWCEDSFDKIKVTPHTQGVLPLLEQMVSTVSAPAEIDTDAPFKMLVTLVEYVAGAGVTVTGKVYAGWLQKGEKELLFVKTREGKHRGSSKLRDITVMKGTTRTKVDVVAAGDIAAISFTTNVAVNATDTISLDAAAEPIESRPIDPPVIVIEIGPNTSPVAGADGSLITLQALDQRLRKEALTNVAIEVEPNRSRTGFEVRGRGELQLGILIETMRREGFEMTISPPAVVYKTADDGTALEPWESLSIDMPSDATSDTIDKMGSQDAELLDMKAMGDRTVLTFNCSSRNFLGVRPFLRDVSKGTAVVMSEFLEYRAKASGSKSCRNGVLISCASGPTTEYALDMVQTKGQLFVTESTPCYPGMILGESATEKDELLNPTKVKPPSNFRGKITDYYKLNVRAMNVENCLAFIEEDEQIEVTPKRINMRKTILDADKRKLKARKDAQGKSLSKMTEMFPDTTGRVQAW
eukprot:GHVS01026301.1.p1 GENE.GHVS01026301.1~~GHVS01026301.1.p1  ORF type:complete len:781 (+),score=139.20 GHVS01026301.1:107-2449(+)